jgi:uroporphyrinogen decarboxylase
MISKERVYKALRKKEGNPDRIPIQFDLCRQLTEIFGKKLGIEPDYALSYYEDLTYRISANEIRTRMGSDVVVVGATVPYGYVAQPVSGNITMNEFGMHMMPTPLYVEVVKCPLENASSVSDIENYLFPILLLPEDSKRQKGILKNSVRIILLLAT